MMLATHPIPFQRRTALRLPLMSSPIRGGFPSPADDYVEARIDLNEELIQHPEATFLARVKGDSMTGAGIEEGDTLVIDRALDPRHDDIVVAIIDNEFTVKRLYHVRGTIRLVAEKAGFPEIGFADGQTCEIWGVVTSIIKTTRKR
jgi:DNA polymerase V